MLALGRLRQESGRFKIIADDIVISYLKNEMKYIHGDYGNLGNLC